MLQKLNERIQGIIAWTIISAIALTFILFGVDYYFQSHQNSDVEAVVNNDVITKQTYSVNYHRIRQQRDSNKITPIQETALKKQILENMIINLITVQGANTAGFHVNTTQADAAIVNIPQFQLDGRFSAERYQQALNAAMYTPDSFQTQVQQGMVLNQQRFAFMGSSFALPNEIKRFVKLYMQTRDYDYLLIPSNIFKKNIHVDALEIKNYYIKHKNDFITPEQVSIDYIKLSMSQIKNNIKLTESDILNFYQENKNSFQTPAEWQVDTVLFAVPEESDQETQDTIKRRAMAAYQTLQHAQGTQSEWEKIKAEAVLPLILSKTNNDKREIAWIIAGTTHKDKYLLNITEPGQFTVPIRTDRGYELLKLLAYKPAKSKPLKEVKPQIINQLTNELSELAYAKALDQLTDLGYQTPDSLAQAAAVLHLPIEKTELFSRAGGNTSISKNKHVIKMAFNHDVLDLGNNSEPLQLDNDSVVMLRINQHVSATPKKLSMIKPSIEQQLLDLHARKKAQNVGEQLLLMEQKQNALSVNVAGHTLQWHRIKDIARDTDSVEGAINSAAFNLSHAQSRNGLVMPNGDYVIMILNKIHDGQYQALDDEQQASLAQQIAASYGIMDYDLYINGLINQAKIQRN